MDYIAASNGDGEAVRAIVTTERLVGATTLIVDSVLNWPAKFVATSGTLAPSSGVLDEATITVFKGVLTGSIITIEEFAPGYSDIGHSVGQAVMLKPSTFWADTLVEGVAADIDASAVATTAEINTAFLDKKFNGVNITGFTDFNTATYYQNDGMWRITSSATANAAANKPATTTQAGWLETRRLGANYPGLATYSYVTQTYTDLAGVIFTRLISTGASTAVTFAPWTKVNRNAEVYAYGTLGGEATGDKTFTETSNSGITKTSATRYTIVTPGLYIFYAQQLINSTGATNFYSKVNGASIHHGWHNAIQKDITTTFTRWLVAGDYITCNYDGGVANIWTGDHSVYYLVKVG